MLGVFLNGRLERAWLITLGLLAACAPLPNGESDSAGGTTQDDTTASGTTAPTTGITTFPGGCEPGSSCGFCSYCDDDGVCRMEGSCCAQHGLDALRCQPPPECYGDDDCPSGVCEGEYCVPAAKLPACGPAALASQWDMSRAPDSFGLADLDGDGSLDLFAPIPTLAAVELAYNDGAGNFATGTMVDLGEPQTDLDAAAGDLDGDGDVDLAVARPDAGDLVLLFGQDGKFLAGPSLPASAPPRSVTVTDADRDGALDLLAIGDSGNVSLWLGDGLGGFSAETFKPELVAVADPTVIDVDLDDDPDILSLAGAALNLYRGHPINLWTTPLTRSLDDDGWSQALAGDLGGKPYPEIVVLRAELGGGRARVSREGQLSAADDDDTSIYFTGTPLTGGRVADVTHDGHPDLVAATGVESVAVLLGDGVGGFFCEQVHPVTAATASDLLALGDIDGDGRTDIIAGTRDGPTITVLRIP